MPVAFFKRSRCAAALYHPCLIISFLQRAPLLFYPAVCLEVLEVLEEANQNYGVSVTLSL